MSRDKTGFGKRITELMSKNGLSVRRCAQLLGLHPSVVQSWKQGTLSTDYEALSKFAATCGCSLDFVLTGHNSSKPGVEDVFSDGGPLYDGYARIIVQRLIPANTLKKKDGGDDE